MTQPQRMGLGALEIVLCAALVLILGLTMVPEALGRSAAANDARRLRDIERIRAAIEAFHARTGRWPAADSSTDYDGWDVSHDGAFIPELVARGFLTQMPLDPQNDDAHHFRYRVIDEPRWACQGAGPWYVLAIITMGAPSLFWMSPRKP